MPPCVECHKASSVVAHGFQAEHFGRHVCGLKNHYFVVSHCYKCTCCEMKAKQTKAAAKNTVEMTGLQLQDHADNIEDAQ